MAQERILKVVEPVFVTITSPDGLHNFREDAYVVRTVLRKAELQPDEDRRWDHILIWLAEKWGVERKELTNNMAIHINNQVMGFIEEQNKELANANFQTASLPDSSAPPTTTVGQ
jgi:hypothetical protein